MSELKKYKLGDLGFFFGGVTSIKKEDYGHGTPFLPYKNVYKNSKVNVNELELMNVRPLDLERRNAVYGDIFFTASSETPDEVAMSSVLLDEVENLTFNGFCKRFRLNDFNTLLPEYARYLFRDISFRRQVYQLATGDIRFNISQESLANIEIEIPDTDTQKEIAQILSSLDDKIELNLQMNQTLEAMAQAIFKEWFVNFNFPGFDGELVDGLPKGWRKEPIDKSIEFLNGLALQKYPPLSDDDFLPVIKIRELRQGVTNSSDKASTQIPEKYVIENGDILFSWSGSLEVVMWCNGQGALNQHLFKVSSEKYPKWFYYYWTKYFLPKYQATASDKATTMGHIQRRHLTESIINVPDFDLLNIANDILEPLLEKLKTNSLQIQSLTQTRDTLLPKLMSGNIEVMNT
jgi:type I restriction enzyme S subunit